MNILKTNPWLGSITLVFAGSFLIYFESYRNNEFIDGISFLLILLGWVFLFEHVTKGTGVTAKKVLFKNDKAGWLKQRSIIAFAYLALLAMLGGNIYCFYQLGFDRKSNLLENEPTGKTTAVITGIQVRRSRYGNSYYAIFQYEVAGKVIQHPWFEEHESDFLVGQQFVIQYSVKYPEMFKIVGNLPPIFQR
jgi:hypothetical protein